MQSSILDPTRGHFGYDRSDAATQALARKRLEARPRDPLSVDMRVRVHGDAHA
jgi:hypothetical protein